MIRRVPCSSISTALPLGLLSILFATGDARGAALSWNNAAGGAAATSTNWSPVQVPTGADDLTFNLNNIYTTTWSAGAAASRSHKYKRGTVTNSMSATHTIGVGGLIIGELSGDVATLTQTTGVLQCDAAAIVANVSGATGTLNVDDDDADLIVGNGADLRVGVGGNATLNITGRGSVQVADQFFAGENSTSVANITISGSLATPPFGSSSLSVLGISDSRIGAGGDVTMTISSGAVASFAEDLIIANGSASTSTVTVQTAVLLNARLNVAGRLLVGRNISPTIAAGDGTLNINTGGTVDVTGVTQLGDPDGGVGTISLGGGTLICDGGIELTANGDIGGTGTITADINTNFGVIAPNGANGITFNGIVHNTLIGGVNGTRAFFGATGGYTGSGSCVADIASDAAAVITATGALSLGRATIAGVSYSGTLDVNTRSVTLVDSNGPVFNSSALVTIDTGGNLQSATQIGISNGARLQGQGTVTGNVINSGILDAQRSGTPGGILNVTGNLTFNPTGSLAVEIGGTPASNMHDRVNVSGTATFNGTVNVTIPNGYKPRVGEQFIVCNATAGRTGEFSGITAPSTCSGVTFVLVYSSTAAIVLVRPPLGCTALGDLNSDGTHSGLEIQEFLNAVLGGPYDNCADMNSDCVNNALDVPIFVNALLN